MMLGSEGHLLGDFNPTGTRNHEETFIVIRQRNSRTRAFYGLDDYRAVSILRGDKITRRLIAS